MIYCDILWYTVIYCGISLPSIGQTSGTMVPSTSEDRSEAEVLHDPHDYDEVPVEEMASRPPMPVPAPSDVYSEVRGERKRAGERGRERKNCMCALVICFVCYHSCVNGISLSSPPSLLPSPSLPPSLPPFLSPSFL